MLLESVLVNLFFMTFDALCQMHRVDTSKGTLKILGQQWLQHCQTQQRVLLLQGKHGVHITNLTDTVRAGKIQQESKHESWFSSVCLLDPSCLKPLECLLPIVFRAVICSHHSPSILLAICSACLVPKYQTSHPGKCLSQSATALLNNSFSPCKG